MSVARPAGVRTSRSGRTGRPGRTAAFDPERRSMTVRPCAGVRDGPPYFTRRASMTRRAFLPALVLLAFVAPPARAQVKLEYKFPEGRKSSFKTNTKTHQVLSI